jgi:hypothetical protein
MATRNGTTWRMYAHLRNGMLVDIGSRSYVLLQREPYPIVEVEVTAVEDGDSRASHFGWVQTGKDEPEMIWPTWDLYRSWFREGPAVQEKAGYGETVRLAVRPTGRRAG